MSSLTIRALLGPKSGSRLALTALCEAVGNNICVVDPVGKPLLGELSFETSVATSRVPVVLDDATLGFVIGPSAPANALALLLTHLAAREAEGRALASEVLHLYREVHLIEQLSEQLAALLNLSTVGQSALAQAQRLIAATHGGILVMEKADGPLCCAASFGTSSSDSAGDFGPLAPDSSLAASILERGIAEIVNNCASDPRAVGSERSLGALICAPLRAGQRTVGVIALANAASGASYSAADLKLLNTIALQTAAAIENSLLCAEMIDAARDREQLASIQHELDTARTIQHLLVPRTFPPFPERTDFDIHAQMTSARAVGGDFFDFFLIDEDRLAVVIGDVSGKGIPAALYMAVTRTQVKTTALRGMTPAECLLEVNRVLVRERVNAMFATCFYGLLNLRTGEFHYCNAGHNLPYILRANGGGVEPIAEVGGIPLGMFDGMEYTGNTVHVRSGDTLFLYTDGVPEARNAAEDDFTEESLIATLAASATLSCQDLIGSMTRKVSAFTDGAAQSDDITMLSIRRL
jgi:serine phosphatase RsbU (regulator of sigma subunit)